MQTAYIALGSNLDNPVSQVNAAISHWQNSADCELIRVSSLYRTPPWGELDQPSFINAVVCLKTTLSPEALLRLCKNIEQKQNRTATYRWGPRTLDCDIIHIEGVSLNSEQLRLPHPRWHERAFVVIPLLEIEPDLKVDTLSVDAALKGLAKSDIAAIVKLSEH